MKPIDLNHMTIMRDPHGGDKLFLGEKYHLNGYRFDRSEVRVLAKLLNNIARHEMPKWAKKRKS